MSLISFRQKLFDAFLYGGAVAAIIFITGHLIEKTHENFDYIEELCERVEKLEERQDHQLKK